MCREELRQLIGGIRKSMDKIQDLHDNDGGYICEPCLINIETLVGKLRLECEKWKSKSPMQE